MFRQWWEVKSRHPDAILFFRMGDFFEMFHDDARVASEALEITLTSRGKGTDNPAPMCGVPHHAADQYVARLVRQGHRVAICDQVEDPRSAKGIVKREVIRVVTPGTLTDPEALEAKDNSYIAAVRPRGERLGLAYLDLSTGEFLLSELGGERLREEWEDQFARFDPKEVLLPESEDGSHPEVPDPAGRRPLVTRLPEWRFGVEESRRLLTEHLGVARLTGYGIEEQEAGIGAAGALLGYVQETQKASLAHVDRIALYDPATAMVVDETTRRNLEIVRNARDGSRRGTLIEVLDRTVTSMGGRMLRSWLLAPLLETGAIAARQAAVAALLEDASRRDSLREALRRVRDVERLLGRVTVGTAGPRDLAGLRDSLLALPRCAEEARPLASARVKALVEGFDPLRDLAALLDGALVPEPPVSAREGGLIAEGHHEELAEIRAVSRDGKAYLGRLESRERERTGITSLKVRFNRVFGYYLEVSRANLDRVPEDYERKQTLVGAERFITPELKEYEQKVLTAEERGKEIEHRLFLELREAVAGESGRLRAAAAVVAELDALASLAEAAAREGYSRPTVDEGDELSLRESRHPVVERLGSEPFIPNDVGLDAESRILIVTGPNMGGKSTYLRQVALIALMAQAGSFVPAREARLGRLDRIFCRVGASDNLAGGESTFMVEMTETANILNNASPRSLVVLDEIGRGTATFDGLSLAWAVVEHLHEEARLRPKTLFATHYHELTELALTLDRVRNVHIAAREHGSEIVFLRKVRPGASDRSYGIQVARLAGVPSPVITRATEILENLESEEFGRDGLPKLARHRRGDAARPALTGQMPLFVPAGEEAAASEGERRALELLREADLPNLTPLEALNRLAEIRAALDRECAAEGEEPEGSE
jgi:DNA mismatch repair protein MutS